MRTFRARGTFAEQVDVHASSCCAFLRPIRHFQSLNDRLLVAFNRLQMLACMPSANNIRAASSITRGTACWLHPHADTREGKKRMSKHTKAGNHFVYFSSHSAAYCNTRTMNAGRSSVFRADAMQGSTIWTTRRSQCKNLPFAGLYRSRECVSGVLTVFRATTAWIYMRAQATETIRTG